MLTLNAASPEHRHGAVAIDRGVIVGVGECAAIKSQFKARETLDAAGTAVLPGLVDAYAHAGHGMVRGIFHPDGTGPGHLYFTATTPDWWRADAELSALERLKAGVTTGQSVIGGTPARADDPVFADVTAQAYAEAGLRLVLGIGPPDPIFPHIPEPFMGRQLVSGSFVSKGFTTDDTLRHSASVIEKWHGSAGGRVRAVLAVPYLFGRHVKHRRSDNRVPEASDAPVIFDHARQMVRLAHDLGVLVHTHMFRGSVDYMLRHFGHAEVDRLLMHNPLVVAHANGLADEEVLVLGQHRIGIATVANTHENVWYGVAPIPALREAGCPVAITTDGAAAYTSYDLWREPSRTAWNQWNAQDSQATMPPETLLGMMTIEAAQVLGMADQIGSLEVGKRADVICVDLRKPHVGPVHDLAQSLMFYSSSADVRDVIVDGKVLLRNGKATLVDEAAVLDRARREAYLMFEAHEMAFGRSDAWVRPTNWPAITKS